MGYSPWSLKESDMTEATEHAHKQVCFGKKDCFGKIPPLQELLCWTTLQLGSKPIGQT